MCARFLSRLLLLYIGRVHGAIYGCTVLWEVHPASAQTKSLISDTEWLPKTSRRFIRLSIVFPKGELFLSEQCVKTNDSSVWEEDRCSDVPSFGTESL